jgi:hypothetical protein
VPDGRFFPQDVKRVIERISVRTETRVKKAYFGVDIEPPGSKFFPFFTYTTQRF